MRTQPLEQYDISPIKLWSPLQRQLAACGLIKGSSQQWLGTIRNLRGNGVSAAEIEWSGILEYLADRSGHKIPLQEMLDALAVEPPCELRLQHLITDDFAPIVRYVKQPRPDPLPGPSLCRGRREVRLLQYKDLSFGVCIWLHVEVDRELTGERFKYWMITVPRGRKHPLANLGGRGFTTAAAALSYGRELIQRMARRLASRGFVGPAQSVNHFTRWVLAGGARYTEWLITAPDFPQSYFGPHFDIRNLVAHVRTTERTSTRGKRLLAIEEIQSDWNQERSAALREANAGAENDPANAEDYFDEPMPPANPYEHHWLEAALRMMLLLAANQGFAGIAWLPGKLHAERFPWAKAEGLMTFYDRIVPAAVEKLAKSWGARLVAAQFSTLSRHFRVRNLTDKTIWQVENLDSGKVIGEDFSNYAAAETFRRSMEVAVVERVTALYLSDEMRDDIRENGLPYLGAVGKRLDSNSLHDEGLLVRH